MKCDDTRNLFAEALYDELDAVTKKEFDDHVSSCGSCRPEYEELRQTLAMMNKRTRVEPTEGEWKEFGRRLDEKLAAGVNPDNRPGIVPVTGADGTAEIPSKAGVPSGTVSPPGYPESTGDRPTSPPNILRWRSILKPAWGYGIAAMFLLAIGFYMGRTFFMGNGPNGPALNPDGPSITQGQTQTVTPGQSQGVTPGQSQGVTPSESRETFTAVPPTRSGDAATKDALDYLERSRNLLIGLTNLDERQSASLDMRRQQEVSRELYNKGNTLTVALGRPSQQQLRQLVQQLQIILLQLSNAGVGDGRPAVELVRQGMSSKSILLKINLEAIRASLGEGTADPTEKSGSNL